MADAALVAQLQAQVAQLQAAAAQAAAPAPAAAVDPATAAYHAAMLAMTMRTQAGPVPTFAGNKGAGLEAHRWLISMQRWFARAAVATDADRLTVVGTQLTGPAQVWWTGELSRPIADPTRIATWAQFESACAARFQPVDTGSTLRSQLAALQRKAGLSVSAYTEQFLEIVALLPDMSEADRAFQYKQGLNPAIHTLIAPLVLPTLREVTEAALRADAHRTAAHGNGASSASSSSAGHSSGSGTGRFGRFAARVAQMEAGEVSSAPLDLVAEMADTIAGLEARVNAMAMGAAPSAGRGGRSQQGSGRGGSSTAPPGGSNATARTPNLHPEPTPGLTSEMAHERIQQRLCVRCGRGGHFKRECTHDAFVSSAKNPSSN